MEQEAVLGGIDKHLSQLRTTVTSAAALAIVVSFAAVGGAETLDVLGVNVPRRIAFIILSLTYLFVNFSTLLIFLRLSDLAGMVEKQNAGRALSTFGLHDWIFSPFSQFTGKGVSLLHGSIGFGSLLIIWSIGYISLLLVQWQAVRDLTDALSASDGTANVWPALTAGGFGIQLALVTAHYAILGVTTMLAIFACHGKLNELVASLGPAHAARMQTANAFKVVFTTISLILTLALIIVVFTQAPAAIEQSQQETRAAAARAATAQ